MLEEQPWQRVEGAPWLRRQKRLQPFQVPQLRMQYVIIDYIDYIDYID